MNMLNTIISSWIVTQRHAHMDTSCDTKSN